MTTLKLMVISSHMAVVIFLCFPCSACIYITSAKIFLSQTIHSTSIVNYAMVGCFLHFNEMIPTPTKKDVPHGRSPVVCISRPIPQGVHSLGIVNIHVRAQKGYYLEQACTKCTYGRHIAIKQ